MSIREQLLAAQEEGCKKWKEKMEAAKKAEEAYRNSEQYLRDQHESFQDLWERKAKKEGWSFTRQPYVSELERQQQADKERREQIAFLKAKLAKLEGEAK